MADKHTHIYQYPTRILMEKDGREYVAHALEFDLVATGDTPEEAKKNLADCIFTQISFCVENNMLDSICRPAPKEFFDKWEKAHMDAFRNGILGKRLPKDIADIIPFPKRAANLLAHCSMA